MYRPRKAHKSNASLNQSVEGETIEKKIRRIINNKEPIQDGADLIFSERKDGVKPEYNIRTDKFERALELRDAGAKSYELQRNQRHNPTGEGQSKGDGTAESTQATGDNT